MIWLSTFGERFVDPTANRPAGRPRLPADRAPKVPADGIISTAPGRMPDTLDYDAVKRRLLVGSGFVADVTPQMWAYNVSGMAVINQWFSSRRANRVRPIIGGKRPPSKLEQIRPDRWLPEYTSDLLDILHVLGLLIDLEPRQAEVLEAICAGPTLSVADLTEAGAFDLPDGYPQKPIRAASSRSAAPTLFE